MSWFISSQNESKWTLLKISWKITFDYIFATLKRKLSKNFLSINCNSKEHSRVSLVLFREHYFKCAYYQVLCHSSLMNDFLALIWLNFKRTRKKMSRNAHCFSHALRIVTNSKKTLFSPHLPVHPSRCFPGKVVHPRKVHFRPSWNAYH